MVSDIMKLEYAILLSKMRKTGQRTFVKRQIGSEPELRYLRSYKMVRKCAPLRYELTDRAHLLLRRLEREFSYD